MRWWPRALSSPASPERRIISSAPDSSRTCLLSICASMCAFARTPSPARLAGDGVRANAHMDAQMLSRHVRLESGAEEMMRRSGEAGLLSARGHHRILRVAQTIADLDASERIRPQDLGAALAVRAPASRGGNRAA